MEEQQQDETQIPGSIQCLLSDNNMRKGEKQRRQLMELSDISLSQICDKKQQDVDISVQSIDIRNEKKFFKKSNEKIQSKKFFTEKFDQEEENIPMSPQQKRQNKELNYTDQKTSPYSQLNSVIKGNNSPDKIFQRCQNKKETYGYLDQQTTPIDQNQAQLPHTLQLIAQLKDPENESVITKGNQFFNMYYSNNISNYYTGSNINQINKRKASHTMYSSSSPSVIHGSKQKKRQGKGLNPVWKQNGILILIFIVKFITFLKGISTEHRFTLLNKVKLDIIGDTSYDYSFYKYKYYMKNDIPSLYEVWIWTLKQKALKFIPKSIAEKIQNPLFYPDGQIKIIWELYLLLSMLACVVYIPLELSFSDNPDFQAYDFRFNLIPLQIPYLNGVQILRAGSILINVDHMSDILNLRKTKKALFDLFKLILVVSLIAHFCGCSFIIVAQNQKNHSQTWLQLEGIKDVNTWVDQYVAAFYFSVITMITVGFGDIYPTNTMERLVTVFLTILSCGVFAYSLNEIGNIFKLVNFKNDKYKENKAILINYMHKKGVNKDLQNRVKRYYEYIFQENLEEKEKADSMIECLPESLKNEISFESNYKLLSEQKILTNNFSRKFIENIALIAEECRVGPEHVIFEEGKQLQYLYFLKSGNIDLSQKVGTKQVFIKSIDNSDNVGTLWFFNNQITTMTAKTQNVVTLLRIEKEKFIYSFVNFPQDFEIFSMMKDNVIFYKSNRLIMDKCRICNFSDHNELSQCQFINFVPNKYQIIYKSLIEDLQRQDRQQFQRKEFKCGNYKTYFHVVKDACLCYLYQNFPDFDYRELYNIRTLDNTTANNKNPNQKYSTFQKSLSNLNFNYIQPMSNNQNIPDQVFNRKDVYQQNAVYSSSCTSNIQDSSISQEFTNQESKNPREINTQINIKQNHNRQNSMASSHSSNSNLNTPVQKYMNYQYDSNDKIKLKGLEQYESHESNLNVNYSNIDQSMTYQSNADLDQSVGNTQFMRSPSRRTTQRRGTQRSDGFRQNTNISYANRQNSYVYYDNTNNQLGTIASESSQYQNDIYQETYKSYQNGGGSSVGPSTFKRYGTQGTYGTLLQNNGESSRYHRSNTQLISTMAGNNMFPLKDEDKLRLRMLNNLLGYSNIKDFEKMKNYEIYFTRGNFSNIIDLLRKEGSMKEGQSGINDKFNSKNQQLKLLKQKLSMNLQNGSRILRTRYKSDIIEKINNIDMCNSIIQQEDGHNLEKINEDESSENYSPSPYNNQQTVDK